MTRRVTVEPLARRMFTGIVSVLHEAGALVCVEGIETEDEALCATDANADLVQGNYFAGPARELPGEELCRETFTPCSPQLPRRERSRARRAARRAASRTSRRSPPRAARSAGARRQRRGGACRCSRWPARSAAT